MRVEEMVVGLAGAAAVAIWFLRYMMRNAKRMTAVFARRAHKGSEGHAGRRVRREGRPHMRCGWTKVH